MCRRHVGSTKLRFSPVISTDGTPTPGCLAAEADPFEYRLRDATPVPELLCAEDTAAVLAISPSTLNRWAARREAGEEVGPPFHALGGKVRRWSTTELAAWLAEQRK